VNASERPVATAGWHERRPIRLRSRDEIASWALEEVRAPRLASVTPKSAVRRRDGTPPWNAKDAPSTNGDDGSATRVARSSRKDAVNASFLIEELRSFLEELRFFIDELSLMNFILLTVSTATSR
jgi:hypothetical protein